MSDNERPTVEMRPPVHVLVFRSGKPCVVSLVRHGLEELACRTFDCEYAAIAYLARLSKW